MAKTGSQYAWWFLSRKQKAALEQERAGGRFGGETAKAVAKAPYFWAQEYGEPRAAIAAKRYVKDAFNRWKGRARGIMSAHFARGS
jgi:hypothetical protein